MTVVPPKPAPTSLWRALKMVAWYFIGIRDSSKSVTDVARVNPLHVVAVGMAGAAVLVVGLVLLVNWVVAK